MHRRVLKLLAGIWLSLCVAITALWLVEALNWAPMPFRIRGPWSIRVSDEWRGKISLIVYHALPTPNIGPQLDPGLKYNQAVLAWYYKQPYFIHRGKWGFDYDTMPEYEISANRNMLLRGDTTRYRMPDWAAGMMWLPMVVPILKWHKRRRRIRGGLCLVCGYDLRSTPDRCPECGASGKCSPLLATEK